MILEALLNTVLDVAFAVAFLAAVFGPLLLLELWYAARREEARPRPDRVEPVDFEGEIKAFRISRDRELERVA